MSKTEPAKATVWEGGRPYNLARIVGADAANITQASISTINYMVTAAGTTVTASSSLTVSAVVYDTLQTDSRWTEDATGYNFAHQVAAADLPDGSTTYLVQYKFVDTNSIPFFLEFELTTKEQYFD